MTEYTRTPQEEWPVVDIDENPHRLINKESTQQTVCTCGQFSIDNEALTSLPQEVLGEIFERHLGAGW